MSESPVIEDNFVILIYPFRHRFTGDDYDSYRPMDSRWKPWWSRHLSTEDDAHPELVRVLDDTFFFLPHVRRLLHPETNLLPSGEIADQIPEATRLARLSTSKMVRELITERHLNGFLRLTLSPESLCFFRDAQLFAPRIGEHQFQASVETDWIDMILGPQQIGLLCWKVHLPSSDLTHAELSEFLYWFRQIYPPAASMDTATWRCGTTRALTTRELFDFLLQGVSVLNEKVDNSLHDFVARGSSLETDEVRYTSTPFAQVYGESCNLFTYAGMLRDDSSADPFPEVNDRRLYELVTATDTGDACYVPSRERLQDFLDNNWISLWNNWRAVALQDSVVFTGLLDGGEDRWSRTFQHNAETDYFQLYYLVFFQKVWINRFFERMVRLDSNLLRNHSMVQHTWEEFVGFDNCLWYIEVTRRPQGTVLFNAFKKGLRSERIYDELKTQMNTLREFYESRVAAGTASLLTFITIIGIPVSIATELYGQAMVESPQKVFPVFMTCLVSLIAAFGVVSLLWPRLWQKVHRWRKSVLDNELSSDLSHKR